VSGHLRYIFDWKTLDLDSQVGVPAQGFSPCRRRESAHNCSVGRIVQSTGGSRNGRTERSQRLS